MTIEKFTEYQAKLLEVVHPFILSSIEANRSEFREIVGNTLFDEDGPRNSTSFTRRDEVVSRKLFLDFEEIVGSYLSLRDIEIYIRRFPYRDTGISSLRYLRYHIESYLNEVYIFKERFETHLAFLERRYQKSPLNSDISKAVKSLKTLIADSLDNIIMTRGEHVHSCRYSDQDLERLSFLYMLSTDNDKGTIFLESYQLSYKEVRKKWGARIVSNNDAVERLFDVCCQKLYSVLFTKEGQFVFPDDRY